MKTKTPDQLRLIHIRRVVKQRIKTSNDECKSLQRFIKQEARKGCWDTSTIIDYAQRLHGYREQREILKDVLIHLDVI